MLKPPVWLVLLMAMGASYAFLQVLFVHDSGNKLSWNDTPSNQSPIVSTTQPAFGSSPDLALVRHLRRMNAKMYAVYWCGVCQQQLQMFSPQAVKELTVIECDPRGKNPQPQRCERMGIYAFPTWEINGKLLPPGGISLRGLAELSGFDGSKNF